MLSDSVSEIDHPTPAPTDDTSTRAFRYDVSGNDNKWTALATKVDMRH
jgi:hypothetical protein